MKDPRTISIASYEYELPAERIADFPAEHRDQSRLLLYKNATITNHEFSDIPKLLPSKSLLILNNTRVVAARLIFKKPTGSKIEIFCLEPDDKYRDMAIALSQTGSVLWKCLVGNASSWTPGLVLEKRMNSGHMITAQMQERKDEHFIVCLSWVPAELTFAQILPLAGLTPLPPYIKRNATAFDATRYQTVYAHHSGSVAAPTAGLHFTPELLNSLSSQNIETDFVTLHVGAGTFRPVKSDSLAGHEMHSESFEIKKSLIEKITASLQTPVVSVGTTTLRTLESMYWIGVKIVKNEHIHENDLHVGQWEPYGDSPDISSKDALTALLKWMQQRNKDVLAAKTSLLIAPPYSFRIVSALVTNFHQPGSTLLLLVAAFIGNEWRSVYSYALENDFRFLSYGDSCLLFRQ